MKTLQLFALCAMVAAGSAVAARAATPQVIGGGSFTNPASGRTYTIQSFCLNANADALAVIGVTDANGNAASPFNLNVPATSGGPIVDQYNVQIAAGVPASISTDVTALVNDLKSALSTAVSQGRFNR